MTRTGRLIVCGLLAGGLLALSGCIQTSGGAWSFESAPTPEGWPATTSTDAVEIKRYPAHRAAVVHVEDLADQDVQSMFMTLFRHIDRNEIAMTAPVEMQYADDGTGERMASMAFLYRSPDVGPAGRDGAVTVQDLPPRTFASLGLRGDASPENTRRGLERLRGWLEEHADEWTAVGPPRYLGYNSPFVLPFLRYGEVQVPVASSDEACGGTPGE